MTTTTLTLFDLTALNPNQPRTCVWCTNQPATTRVYAIQNLLGIHPAQMAATWYRNASRRAHSGPCCDQCAWYVAGAWWNPVMSCPGGSCCLWAHTLAAPQPAADCARHHHENHVVWSELLAVTA